MSVVINIKPEAQAEWCDRRSLIASRPTIYAAALLEGAVQAAAAPKALTKKA